MAMPRLSFVDIAILAVVAVAIFLPAREMYAQNAISQNAAARKIAPRKLRLSDEREQSPVALESVDPPAIRSHDG